MIARETAEAVLREVIAACDPAARVRAAVAWRSAGRRLAFAAGKAALAMARGAGPVDDGIAVVPRGGGGAVPGGWRVMEAAHPEPDATSVAAGEAVVALVRAAAPGDEVLALISGGASALLEVPRGSLAALVARAREVMASGAPIAALNRERQALSRIKGGQLARLCAAPIATLAVSDVIGDDLAVIGSGPTIAGRPQDRARVIAPMASAGEAAVAALAARGLAAALVGPILGAPEAVAAQLLAELERGAAPGEPEAVAAQLVAELERGEVPGAPHGAAPGEPRGAGPAGPDGAGPAGPDGGRRHAPRGLVAWGEPTLALPADPGVGGRAQQLALVLARALRGTARSALVVGTDGVDGPPPPDRPAPAGAWVDGATWDAIAAAGIDPAAALARCDAGPALAAVGALIVTGPSGINHADLVVLA